jgi:hypothetical protein
MKVERHRRLNAVEKKERLTDGVRYICSLSSGAACSLEWLAMGILKFSAANKGLMWIQLTAVCLTACSQPSVRTN